MSEQRERFEAWAKSKNSPIAESKITGVGVTYKYATTESAWQAWQAACPSDLQPGLEWAIQRCEALNKQDFTHSRHDVLIKTFKNCLSAAPKPEDV